MSEAGFSWGLRGEEPHRPLSSIRRWSSSPCVPCAQISPFYKDTDPVNIRLGAHFIQHDLIFIWLHLHRPYFQISPHSFVLGVQHVLLWGHISIHDKCTVFSEGLNNERRNEVLSLCPLKYTPLSPFFPSPTSYFLHPYSDNFALSSAPGLCFPIQPSYSRYIILLKYSLHQLIYLTKGLPSWLTFSYFIKSKTTLPPFRSYCPLNLVYLLYFRQCLGLPCVAIHTRLEESWGKWKSKNWPCIWGRQNLEGGPGEFLGIARLNNISEKTWSQVNRKMQTASEALRKGATSPNRWVGPRHRKSKTGEILNCREAGHIGNCISGKQSTSH